MMFLFTIFGTVGIPKAILGSLSRADPQGITKSVLEEPLFEATHFRENPMKLKVTPKSPSRFNDLCTEQIGSCLNDKAHGTSLRITSLQITHHYPNFRS
jgi:hypothetical protein